MKTKILAPLLLFSMTRLFSQEPAIATKVISSPNGRYDVIVRGFEYEGFAGDQRISLLDKYHKDTLWSRDLSCEGLQYPCVSNKGDVAIFKDSILIIRKDGSIKGAYHIESNYQPLGYSIGGGDAIQSFSSNSDRYYVFLRSPKDYDDAVLLCLNDSAKEIWQDNLGHFDPATFFFYGTKIIISGGGHSPTAFERCAVLNINDDQLWHYDLKYAGAITIQLDSKRGLLKIKDGYHNEIVQLDTLNAP